MRYVDIDLLQLPDEWQEQANRALDDLRTEIMIADTQARASAEDVTTARRKAISDGLKKPARQAIWRALLSTLGALSQKKCWYSESRNPACDMNVDHFRPKNRVAEDLDHEGYWWLAFSWQNYRYSSQWCNQRRVDGLNGTSGGKADHFPLCDGSTRARIETDDYTLEEPELLDPINPNDWKLLSFRQDGHPIPAIQSGTVEYNRAEKSIEVFHLHCKELVEDRRFLAGYIQRLVQNMEILRSKISDKALRNLYTHQVKELLRKISPNTDYSAAALAYAKAEVYIYQAGHQVKREWLEEIIQ